MLIMTVNVVGLSCATGRKCSRSTRGSTFLDVPQLLVSWLSRSPFSLRSRSMLGFGHQSFMTKNAARTHADVSGTTTRCFLFHPDCLRSLDRCFLVAALYIPFINAVALSDASRSCSFSFESSCVLHFPLATRRSLSSLVRRLPPRPRSDDKLWLTTLQTSRTIPTPTCHTVEAETGPHILKSVASGCPP